MHPRRLINAFERPNCKTWNQLSTNVLVARSPPLLTERIDYVRMTEASIGLSIATTTKAAGYPECEVSKARLLALFSKQRD
jgi:hypothetical protein